MTEPSDPLVRLERDDSTGIARITLDDPEKKNAYDPPMRRQLGAYLEECAWDDDVKVVLLRGEGGVFSTGADMNNAYAWYGDNEAPKDGEKPRMETVRFRSLGCSSIDASFHTVVNCQIWLDAKVRREPTPIATSQLRT